MNTSDSLHKIHGNNTGSGNSTSVDESYDSEGAMTYLVIVIIFYSFGMICVVVWRLVSRRKSKNVDKQADNFLRTIYSVRRSNEKKERLMAITKLMHMSDLNKSENVSRSNRGGRRTAVIGSGMLKLPSTISEETSD